MRGRGTGPARWMLACALAAALIAPAARAQHLLVPMDDAQANHLKAYGVTFTALVDGVRSEWLLNYRGGSFLLPDVPNLRRAAALAGVSFEAVGPDRVQEMRREISEGNMDAVPLEKAPRIAVYTPPDSPPWDDAVTLALTYAGIEFTSVWDDDVLKGVPTEMFAMAPQGAAHVYAFGGDEPATEEHVNL